MDHTEWVIKSIVEAGSLSAKQKASLIYWVEPMTLSQRAAKIGVNRVTLWRWLAQKDYQRAVKAVHSVALRIALQSKG